jgi:NAD(P)-dependent dehydrogenase (short-subunit alcohol dehydrogenase family)
MKRLENRVAIVTGAGSSGPGWGNGKATAVTFAREGAKVLAVDINLKAAEETSEIIRGEGGTVLPLRADVSKSDEVKALVERCLAEFGRVDILHNNVGINRKGGAAALSEADWDLVIDTNLKAMFLTCRAVLPVMEQQGKGAIVNVSSITALRYARRPYIAYATSKGGILAFTRTLAIEYAAKGIRANAILPGHINTPMVHVDNAPHPDGVEGFIRERDKWVPMGRMGTAWDVANAALFLASDESSYITGTELVVDGGLTAATAW